MMRRQSRGAAPPPQRATLASPPQPLGGGSAPVPRTRPSCRGFQRPPEPGSEAAPSCLSSPDPVCPQAIP